MFLFGLLLLGVATRIVPSKEILFVGGLLIILSPAVLIINLLHS